MEKKKYYLFLYNINSDNICQRCYIHDGIRYKAHNVYFYISSNILGMLSSCSDYKKLFELFPIFYAYTNCFCFFNCCSLLCILFNVCEVLHGNRKINTLTNFQCWLFYENSFVTILKLPTANRPFHFPRNTQITPLMESVNRKLPRPYTHFTFPQQI